MPMEEIEKIRSCSETYRYLTRMVAEGKDWAKKKLDETPWVKWIDEMAVKSVIKRTCKQLDLTPQLAAASNIDTLADQREMDLRRMENPEFAMDVVEGVVDPISDDEEDGEEKDEVAAIEKPEAETKTPADKKSDAKKATPPKKPAPEKEPEQPADGPQEPEGEVVDPETGEIGTVASPASDQETEPATGDPGAQRAEDPGPPEEDEQKDWGDFTD